MARKPVLLTDDIHVDFCQYRRHFELELKDELLKLYEKFPSIFIENSAKSFVEMTINNMTEYCFFFGLTPAQLLSRNLTPDEVKAVADFHLNQLGSKKIKVMYPKEYERRRFRIFMYQWYAIQRKTLDEEVRFLRYEAVCDLMREIRKDTASS